MYRPSVDIHEIRGRRIGYGDPPKEQWNFYIPFSIKKPLFFILLIYLSLYSWLVFNQ